MTECIQARFEFAAHFSRGVVAEFDGEQSSSDGGGCCCGRWTGG